MLQQPVSPVMNKVHNRILLSSAVGEKSAFQNKLVVSVADLPPPR